MPKVPTESTVLASILRYLSGLKNSGVPIHWLKIHGGPAQRSGEPDLMICLNGQLFMVEVKRPGAKATALQEHRLAAWSAAGALTICVDNLEVLNEFILKNSRECLEVE